MVFLIFQMSKIKMITDFNTVADFEANKKFLNEGVPVYIAETGNILMKFEDSWVDVELIRDEVHHAKD